MDTGQVLAEREMNIAHPPASTIKTLLVLTALDEVTNLDATVVGTEADTHVECSCAGIEPGRTYTARQLLDARPADVGQRRGQCAGRHDRRLRHRGGQDERQGGAAIGALGTHAATPSGLDGPGGAGATTPRDLAVIFRAAMANPVFAQTIAQPAATFPTDDGRQADRQRRRTAAPLSRHPRRQDRIHRRGEEDVRRRPPTVAGAAW